MKKLIMLLSICLCLISFPVFASSEDEQKYAGEQLKTLGILKGYPDGSLGLDKNITRAEIATMMVRALGYENSVLATEGQEFKDVPTTFWGHGNIQNAFKLKIVNGYPDTTFKPAQNITYAEMVAMMVKTLVNGAPVTGEWPQNYIDKGKALGVIPTTATVDAQKIINRGEAAKILWDTLLAKKSNE